jgi:hypothetical protein
MLAEKWMLRRQLQGLKWAPPAISNQEQRMHTHEWDLLAKAFPVSVSAQQRLTDGQAWSNLMVLKLSIVPI